MHQHPRPSPRVTSPATSPQTNPTRTNNQREAAADRTSSSLDLASSQERGGWYGMGEPAVERTSGQPKEDPKLNQVIQQFFYKASLSILSARTTLPQSFKPETHAVRVNKWFNVVLDETDTLTDVLWEWKNANVSAQRPPPLVIEIYLDTSELTNNQVLVVIDEEGRRWDLNQILSLPVGSANTSPSTSGRETQVILERWSIELGDPSAMTKAQLRDSLPNVYKKAVILFKSLYTYTRMLPAWKLWRTVLKQPANQTALKPHYRIVKGDSQLPAVDTLNMPLYSGSEPVTEQYTFAPTHSPAGPFVIQVSYRVRCEFRVDASEALLSSQFMGMDDYFTPSLAGQGVIVTEPGSLPINSNDRRHRPDLGQAYGSMSTFHQVGHATGTSPLSALRAARDRTDSSPKASPAQKPTLNYRQVPDSKTSTRPLEGAIAFTRRPSVSFQPFKAGSLSSSPAPGPVPLPSPGSSLGRASNPSPLAQARNRTSLTTLPQVALRTPSLPNETVTASSMSSSPKPAPIARYSSSFGHRRSRLSSGGASKTEEEGSSGKASVSSSNQPGSGLLTDVNAASQGSVQTDEDTISDFLKLLEKGKDLKSFSRSDAESREASTKRIAAQLHKYHRMPDSNAQLSDSMSSSHLLHRSSSSSSRNITNVPALGGGASLSTSSSPGKPISPHTPHTPAVPSRLSANSVIDYSEQQLRRNRIVTQTAEELESEEVETETVTSGAIDIPTSPRQTPHPRRTSSFSQRRHTVHDDVGMHSTSLPLDERPDLSLSELFNLHGAPRTVPTAELSGDGANDAGLNIEETVSPLTRHHLSTSADSRDSAFGQRQPGTSLPQAPYRARVTSIRGRGSRTGSTTSSIERGGGSGSGESSRAGRYSFSPRGGGNAGAGTAAGGFEDDEPLLFAIDDSQGVGGRRRSVENVAKGWGGIAAGAGTGVAMRRPGSPPRRG